MNNLISMLIFLAVFTLNNNYAYSQTPSWLWAQRDGGTYDDAGFGIATEGLGNCIVTGGFRDAFVAKYDGDGNLLWEL